MMSPHPWKFWFSAAGLSLLYTSAYYLPYAEGPQNYWLPYTGREILYPSVIGTLLLIPVAWYFQGRYLKFGLRHPVGLLGIVILGLDVIVSAMSTLGYSTADLLLKYSASTSLNLSHPQWFVAGIVGLACVAVVAIAGRTKRRLSLIRALSILGCCYAILALLRLAPTFMSDGSTRRAPAQAPPPPAAAIGPAGTRPREVVWIIFDELDYGETLGSDKQAPKAAVPHLFELSHMGVSATQAYSPARDTIVSLPSLLMAQFPAGYKIDRSGLFLHLPGGAFEPFIEANTVFAKLPGGPTSGALLGYYHPYCEVLPDVKPCVAMPMVNVGRWYDALLPSSERIAATLRQVPGSPFLPGVVFRVLHPMYRITEETMKDYPSFLGLEGHSLVFLHVNLPHYPAEYAQRVLNLRSVVSHRNGYDGNLLLVDSIVDSTIRTLQAQSKARDIMLIVSSDHWHRLDFPNTPQTIPWIAWHVGEGPGPALTQQINTVHTGELALDFLRGRIQSQQDVPAWWRDKSFLPPLMPDHYDE